MQFIWNDLIHRARVYKDDDHDDEDSWLDPADWLTLFNVEYGLLYPRWVRSGLIAPAYTESSPFANSIALTNILAIVGVARLDGGRYYPIRSAQQLNGRASWLDPADTGTSEYWEATGTGDNLQVTLWPVDTSVTYVVRYITRPAYVTDGTTSVELPFGGDERLVLGAVDRAGIKDSAASKKVSEKIFEADTALGFLAAGRLPAQVRRNIRSRRTDRFAPPFPLDSRYWNFY